MISKGLSLGSLLADEADALSFVAEPPAPSSSVVPPGSGSRFVRLFPSSSTTAPPRAVALDDPPAVASGNEDSSRNVVAVLSPAASALSPPSWSLSPPPGELGAPVFMLDDPSPPPPLEPTVSVCADPVTWGSEEAPAPSSSPSTICCVDVGPTVNVWPPRSVLGGSTDALSPPNETAFFVLDEPAAAPFTAPPPAVGGFDAVWVSDADVVARGSPELVVASFGFACSPIADELSAPPSPLPSGVCGAMSIAFPSSSNCCTFVSPCLAAAPSPATFSSSSPVLPSSDPSSCRCVVTSSSPSDFLEPPSSPDAAFVASSGSGSRYRFCMCMLLRFLFTGYIL
mmetsp:Transcript_25133/g.63260  ORF Transcript_25133/g.63260 Transcript_25133/m.63260 type:complete len:341 (+) Transcript_25133:1790-2812(+)